LKTRGRFDRQLNRYLNKCYEETADSPLAAIDCFGILNDVKIKRYFELGCEVKFGPGPCQRDQRSSERRKRRNAAGIKRQAHIGWVIVKAPGIVLERMHTD